MPIQIFSSTRSTKTPPIFKSLTIKSLGHFKNIGDSESTSVKHNPESNGIKVSSNLLSSLLKAREQANDWSAFNQLLFEVPFPFSW